MCTIRYLFILSEFVLSFVLYFPKSGSKPLELYYVILAVKNLALYQIMTFIYYFRLTKRHFATVV